MDAQIKDWSSLLEHLRKKGGKFKVRRTWLNQHTAINNRSEFRSLVSSTVQRVQHSAPKYYERIKHEEMQRVIDVDSSYEFSRR